MSKEKKGRKIGRNKRHQSVAYRASGRLERNRKRRWRRTLRAQPENQVLLARYKKEFGEYEGTPSPRVAKSQAAKRRRDQRRGQPKVTVVVTEAVDS